jgi:STE24 endopeptidase
MQASTVTALFVAALLLSMATKFWLATRQMRHVALHRERVPDAFAGSISLESHRRGADYTLAKGRFGLLSSAFAAAVVLAWTLLGGLDALNQTLLDAVRPRWGDMAYQLALLAAFALIGGVLELPFELVNVFRIEQRFGFNRMTPRLFATDLLKQLVLGLVIGLPLAALVLWLMGAAGRWWWLWAWGAWVAFNLLCW